MIPETLDSLIRAGADALQTTCGLTVTRANLSLVKEGSLTFPALGELRIRNGSLQRVHLGCDTPLVGQLAGLAGGSGSRSGLEILANRILVSLLEDTQGRRPRGTVENLAVEPVTLFTRGRRTFGIRLETDAGRLFFLAEVPSVTELEEARNSFYVTSLAKSYLACDWSQRNHLPAGAAIDNLLVFIRKAETDLFLEIPGASGATAPCGAFALSTDIVDGRRALKLCTDLTSFGHPLPARGDPVRATMGLEDRFLSFTMEYLDAAEHSLAVGANLPCAWFSVPEDVAIGQRRRSFRIPMPVPVAVEVESARGLRLDSPWGDGEGPKVSLSGRVGDLSFAGARIVMAATPDGSALEVGSRVRCHFHLPDEGTTLEVAAVIRRQTLSLADRNEWQREIGIEFLMAGDQDRIAIDEMRAFVLAMQRRRLAQRIDLVGAGHW